MNGISPLQKEWQNAWEGHLANFKTGATSWDNDGWRESFELIGASLIYSYNAMKLVPDAILHKSVRKAIPNSQVIWKLLTEKEPNFHENTGKHFNALYSTMHMASSSFRLPTALYLIEKERLNKAKGPLTDMLKPADDWERSKFNTYREEAKRLKCCEMTKPLSLCSHKDGVKIALAILLDHRDEFGHGEEGRTKDRSKLFNSLHLFRILEAQVVLVNYAVKELARIK